MKRIFGALAAVAIAALAAVAGPSFAQPAGSFQAITPLTRSLGSIRALTGAVAGTYNSADQSGYNVARVTCVLNHASKVGTPSNTWEIQGKDAASGLYYTLIGSAATTNTATANPLSVGSGVTTTANASAGLPVPATWRVQSVITGTTSFTGTIGCSVS